MDSMERCVQLAGWILKHHDTWLRMCQAGEARELPLDKTRQESRDALRELEELGFYELILVYATLNVSTVGEGYLRVLLRQISEPQPEVLTEMTREIIEVLERQLEDMKKEEFEI